MGETEEVDLYLFEKLKQLIHANFSSTPLETVYQYKAAWSKVHLTLVRVPNGFSSKKYLVVGNPNGRVDIIEHGHKEAYKQLAIESMQCSYIHGSNMLIGASNRLFLVDMSRDFAIVSHCTTKRHIFTICAMSSHQFVLG